MSKINVDHIMTVDEVVEAASEILNNVMAFCASCHAQIDRGRADRRQKLGLAVLCPQCAQHHTTEYVGAERGGELVKTTNPHDAEYVRKYNRGSHAMQ